MSKDAPSNEPPKLSHTAPPWFHDRWQELRQWLIENRAIAGTDIEITDAPGRGKAINVKSRKKDFLRPHPFAAFLHKLIGSSLEHITKIEIKLGPGTILETCTWDDVVAVGGIDDGQEMEVDDYCWFEVTVDADGALTSIDLKSGVPADEGWDIFPVAYKMLNPGVDKSETWWHIVCKLRELDEEEDRPIVAVINSKACTLDPYTTTNLIFRWDCAPDASEMRIRLLAPWTGGFTGE